jgi:hypothetical protein
VRNCGEDGTYGLVRRFRRIGLGEIWAGADEESLPRAIFKCPGKFVLSILGLMKMEEELSHLGR